LDSTFVILDFVFLNSFGISRIIKHAFRPLTPTFSLLRVQYRDTDKVGLLEFQNQK